MSVVRCVECWFCMMIVMLILMNLSHEKEVVELKSII